MGEGGKEDVEVRRVEKVWWLLMVSDPILAARVSLSDLHALMWYSFCAVKAFMPCGVNTLGCDGSLNLVALLVRRLLLPNRLPSMRRLAFTSFPP